MLVWYAGCSLQIPDLSARSTLDLYAFPLPPSVSSCWHSGLYTSPLCFHGKFVSPDFSCYFSGEDSQRPQHGPGWVLYLAQPVNRLPGRMYYYFPVRNYNIELSSSQLLFLSISKRCPQSSCFLLETWSPYLSFFGLSLRCILSITRVLKRMSYLI